jgi:glycosyltransferase involved in cell wall biosynthesis
MTTHTAVVTRTKNRPLLLRRAIASVLDQTQRNWTHIIVNDGGDPREVESLGREYSEKYAGRLTIVHNTQSLGMEAASNLGITQSASDYILIHDDDDSLHPCFLERTMDYLDHRAHPTIQGVATLTTHIEERVEGNIVSKVREKPFRKLGALLSAAQIAEANQIPPISFLFRREAYEAVGRFDESLPVLGDWEFLLRFISRFDVGVVPEALANYHFRIEHAGAMTNSLRDRSNDFSLYDSLIRNRMFREGGYSHALAALLQQGTATHRIRALYRHPVIGTFIKLWSRFFDASIPPTPY